MSIDTHELLAPHIEDSMVPKKMTELLTFNREASAPYETDSLVEMVPAEARFSRPVVANTKCKDGFMQIGRLPETYERREPSWALESRTPLGQREVLRQYTLLSFLTALGV